MVRAIAQALARVSVHGVAAVAIRESHYAGCLAAYRERATSKGCMILSTCSDPTEASVAPCGGLQPLFTPESILIDLSASNTTNGMTGPLQKASAPAGGR